MGGRVVFKRVGIDIQHIVVAAAGQMHIEIEIRVFGLRIVLTFKRCQFVLLVGQLAADIVITDLIGHVVVENICCERHLPVAESDFLSGIGI